MLYLVFVDGVQEPPVRAWNPGFETARLSVHEKISYHQFRILKKMLKYYQFCSVHFEQLT